MTEAKNFNFLKSVVDTLKYSQGFYSRLAAQLETLSSEDIQELEKRLPAFNDTLDVIFYLEQ